MRDPIIQSITRGIDEDWKEFWDRCTLVDESNNVIIQLPIAQEPAINEDKAKESILKINKDYILEAKKENQILTIIKHEPTVAMNQLYELSQIPFILLYQPGVSQPKICKAINTANNTEYALVHPSKEDIKKYLIHSSNNSYSHKFPIVGTVIQKLDSNQKIQTLVTHGGLSPQLVDSFEGASGFNVNDYFQTANSIEKKMVDTTKQEQDYSSNGSPICVEYKNESEKTTVIYTKTQPSVRQAKSRIPFEKQQNKENVRVAQFCLDGFDDFPEEDNKEDFMSQNWMCPSIGDTQSVVYIDDKTLEPLGVYNLPQDLSVAQNLDSDSLSIIPEIKPALSTRIKLTNENVVENQEFNDIEPTLFSSLEALKEPFSKYNIDFDGDAFDLFEDCEFTNALLDGSSSEDIKSIELTPKQNADGIKQEENMYLYTQV